MLQSFRFFLALCLTALLVGCGDSRDVVSGESPTTPQTSITYNAKVVGEGGAPLANTRVVLQERSTRAKLEASTGNDGTFQIVLPYGVYDLGLDREGDSSTATCFYGPLTSPGAGGEEFVLRNSGGRSTDTVFGRLLLRPGVVGAGRTLKLVPGAIMSGTDSLRDLPSPTAVTDADGTFSFQLGSSSELCADIEVYDEAQNLDEFLVLGKLEKPCYVEMSVEDSAVENRFRCNESELELLSETSPQGVLAQQIQNFTFLSLRDSFVMLGGGYLPVSQVNYFLGDLVDGLPDPLAPLDIAAVKFIKECGIRVGDNGMLWWKYAVNIRPIVVTEDPSSHWCFGDAIGGPDHSYSLSVYRNDTWHKVSYNSDNPAITYIEVELDF